MNGTIEETTNSRNEAPRGRLIYRVEQLFLIHRASNRLLLHVADPTCANDDVTVLPRVASFAREYFFIGEETAFEELPLGLTNGWIALGPQAYLVAVIRGNAPEELRQALQDTLAAIHAQFGDKLANFTGDPSPFLAAGSALVACLRSGYQPAAAPLRFRAPSLPAWRFPEPRLPSWRLPQMRLPAWRPRWPARSEIPWRIVAGLVGLFLLAGWLTVRAQQRWHTFVARLKTEPGIVVAQSEWHLFGTSRIAGRRDPLAKDPAAIAREAKLNPARILSDWKEYAASDPVIVQRRFLAHFGAVEGVQIAVNDSIVSIRGRVSDEWLERVRREATEVPGVTAISEHDLTITYDPGRALRQFREQFDPPDKVHAVVANNTLVLAGAASLEWIAKVREGATKIPGISAINGDSLLVEFSAQAVIDTFRQRFEMPDGVNASFRNGALILSGEASHQWLDSVRRSWSKIPGVRMLDERDVQDIDQREFRETEATIDAATILFVLNRDTLPPDPNGALARVAEDTKRCFKAAERMGVNVKLELRGYGDATDSDSVNAGRSRRRVDAVRAALISAGIDEQRIDSLGMGSPPPPGPGEKRGAGLYDRRVFFRIVIQP